VCPECGKGELLLQQRSARVSVAGLFGAFMAVVGFVVLFFNAVVGLLVVICGVLVGYFGRAKHTEAVCPMCGFRKSL
jgi:uncharacterized membrane protein